jgi:RNA 2',3'-cyclic 3'-phosphodiesterase
MSRGLTARLFAAIELPLWVAESLAEWACLVADDSYGRRGGIRSLPAHSLHLTLCFLGSRPVGEIAALGAALDSYECPACELSLGAPLWLPARRPRALAVEVHDREGELRRAQSHLCEALERAATWEPERRRFRPHITLMRIGRGVYAPRGSRGDRAAAEPPLLPPTPDLEFAPEAIVLYRSWLDADGASYEPLMRNELVSAGG